MRLALWLGTIARKTKGHPCFEEFQNFHFSYERLLCGEGACSRWGAKRPQEPVTVIFLEAHLCLDGGCCAAQREQARSPQQAHSAKVWRGSNGGDVFQRSFN